MTMAIPYRSVNDFIAGSGVIDYVCKNGVRELSTLEYYRFICIAYFHDRSTPEQRQIEEKMSIICEAVIFNLIRVDRQNLQSLLKSLFADLKLIRDGLGKGKRPRLKRQISAAALEALTFQLPADLLPPSLSGSSFSDFGRFAIQPFDPNTAQADSDLVFTSFQSSNMNGYIEISGACDRNIAVGFLGQSIAPHVIHKLLSAETVTGNGQVTVETIRRLSPDELRALQDRAAEAIKWLMAVFSIKSVNDPLAVDAWQLLTPRATHAIVSEVANCLAPWPDYERAVELNRMLSKRALDNTQSRSGFHEDMDKTVYDHIFNLIRRAYNAENPGNEFSDQADALGLLAPESDAYDRHVEYFCRVFRQIREINRVRCHLIEVIKKKRRSHNPAEMVELSPSDGFLVSMEDYHNLRRWSDYLKGLMTMGLVERGKDESSRMNLPLFPAFDFPRIPGGAPLELMTKRLVVAGRKSNKTRSI